MKLDLVLDEGQLPWRPTADWITRAQTMLDGVAPGPASARATVQFVLTDDDTLREHNRSYRDKDVPTDVLSFSYLVDHEDSADAILAGEREVLDFLDEPVADDEDPLVGQILVSLDTVLLRGPVHAADVEGEIAFMLAHGCLHVIGFDHHDDAAAAAMETAENELMRRGGFAVIESDVVPEATTEAGPEGDAR